ncbi:hypothetical protein OPV22_028999 [Ensete ventricosum]|uniref:BZIP domain-containing protein n=1 Tax=Ensete ventricosum TaxID=4639 RepID=A0AAV8PMG6_ENSVE|nr:hypothetical protein OPV22_034705 [Ensete ventricosum]KAJ8466447.1 hypothetical protein OPV22_028999 [Ensete ventricosum]RZS20849.1 hypothetical protein BHM03_00053423 [Ensete ventricosum]
MSSFPVPQASSSEGDPQLMIDERNRKRMLSNRESARRSRIRKQQHLDDLIYKEAQLKNQNCKIAMQINLVTQKHTKVEAENAILRAQVSELTERLRSVNSVLHFFEGVSGMTIDTPKVPDPLLKPLQFPSAAQPIIANDDIFQL